MSAKSTVQWIPRSRRAPYHAVEKEGDKFDLAADDMAIFVTAELPAYLEWTFGPEAVKAIGMPVQVIYADNTVKMSRETVDVLGHWHRGIVMTQIPAATHFFPLTHPTATAKAIADFAVAAERR